MRRLPPYNRLSNNSNEDWTSSEDNLLNGTDCTNYSSAIRVGYLVRHILNQHIKYYDYQQWQNEPDTAVPTTSGAAGPPNVTAPGAVAARSSGSSSKLRKMWKRVKKVFSVGSRRRGQQLSLTNDGSGTTDDQGGGSGPSTSLTATARASTSSGGAAATSGRSPGNSKRTVALPHIYCGRYTNPGFVLRHCSNYNPIPSGPEPTFSSIKNGNIQELDMKLKVQAWVSHLNNPTASALTAALMSTSKKNGSSGSK